MYLNYLELDAQIKSHKWLNSFGQNEMVFGDCLSSLKQVLTLIAPYLKVVVVYSKSFFITSSRCITGAIKSNQNRVINVIVDSPDLTISQLQEFLHLPEDIRAIITLEPCNFELVRYASKIKNVHSICVCTELNSFNLHTNLVGVRYNQNFDYIVADKSITIVDKRACITDKSVEIMLANVVLILELKIYCGLFSEKYSYLLNCLQSLYDKRNFSDKALFDTFCKIDLIISYLPKELRYFSSLEMAKKFYKNGCNQLSITLSIFDYVLNFSSVKTNLPYYERAKKISKNLNISYIDCLSKLKWQMQILNNKNERLFKLYNEIKSDCIKYKKLIESLLKIQEVPKLKKEKLKILDTCGDYELNLISVLRQVNI